MSVENLDERRVKRRHQLRSQVKVRNSHTGKIIGQVANLHQEGLMIFGSQLNTHASYQIELLLPNSVHAKDNIALGVECLWYQGLSTDENLFWSGCSIIDKTTTADQCITSLIQRQVH